MLRQRYFLVLCALFLTFAAAAQRRSVQSTLLQPELQAEYALKGDDYALLGVRGAVTETNSSRKDLDRLGINLAYERFWSDTWSGGFALRPDFYRDYRPGTDVNKLYVDVTPELFVRHWNSLGSFNVRQRLSAEYFIPGAEGAEGRALARLRLDLDRVFPLGEKIALRPRLAYEAAAYLRLQRDEDEPKERFVDFGTLRAEAGVRFSPRFDLTPWLAYGTQYIIALPQFDDQGRQVSGGRTNQITPQVGLDLRLTLFRGGTPFERRQLPTQH